MPDPVRTAVITEPGGDHFGSYVTGLVRAAGVSELAIADPGGKPPATAPAAKFYRDHREMLLEFRPHLVVITVEPRHAPAVISDALEANAHVVSEKPPCTRLDQFESLAAKARSKQRELMLSMATRCLPMARKVRELVASGQIGQPYGVTMNWVADQTRVRRPEWQRGWHASKARAGGGKLIYHGIHYLDLIRWWVDSPVAEVCGFCRNVGGQPIETEDAAVISMRFANGMVGTLNAGYYLDRGYSRSVLLWGSKGWVRYDPAVPIEWYTPASGVQRLGDETGDAYHFLMQAAVDFVRGAAPPVMTTSESLEVIRAVFAGYRAAESGRSIKV